MYLERAAILDREIDVKFRQVQQLRALAERRTAVYGPGARGGGHPDARMDILAKIIDLERELDADIDHLVDMKREIAGVIAAVADDRLRMLLELRYINGCKWDEVAQVMRYDRSNIWRMHNAALRAVAAMLAG